MKIVNLSTPKLNDHHSYYGGAIGNIAYNLLARLAERPGIEVYSTVAGTDFQHPTPPDLHLREVSGWREHHAVARRAAPQADVLTHLYFHEPEYSPVLDVIQRADAPFVIGMCEAPHERYADERDGLARFEPARRVGKRLFTVPHRCTWRQADRAIYVTDHARAYYRERYGTPNGGRVIPYGVDTDRFTPAPIDGRPRILVVSRLIRRRGIQHLVAALPRIRSRVPRVQVDIVGEGAFGATLKRRVTARGLADRVTFHGQVDADALWQLYRDCWVFCHLSADDGWNQPALEAMATARPVVATDRPHNPMVVDGETGTRVPWADPDAVAAAVSDLLCDREKATQVGQAGRAIVDAEYRWPRIAAAYERALRGVEKANTQNVSE